MWNRLAETSSKITKAFPEWTPTIAIFTQYKDVDVLTNGKRSLEMSVKQNQSERVSGNEQTVSRSFLLHLNSQTKWYECFIDVARQEVKSGSVRGIVAPGLDVDRRWKRRWLKNAWKKSSSVSRKAVKGTGRYKGGLIQRVPGTAQNSYDDDGRNVAH